MQPSLCLMDMEVIRLLITVKPTWERCLRDSSVSNQMYYKVSKKVSRQTKSVTVFVAFLTLDE